MPSSSLEKIGVLHTERHRYLVKGLKLPPSEAADPLVQLLKPYYAAKENFIIVTPPFSGKLDALLKMAEALDGACAIVTGGQHVSDEQCVQTVAHGEAESYRHLAFYNTKPDPSIIGRTTAHISVFIDYTRLADLCGGSTMLYSHSDASWYKDAVSAAAVSLVSPFGHSYTSICTSPRQQMVEFAFATSEDLVPAAIEQLIIPEHTLIYAERGHSRPIPGREWVSEIPAVVKCRKFIFADIPFPEQVVHVLDRIESVTFIYKTTDFAKLGTVCEILTARGIPIPDHILDIMQSANKRAE